MKVREWLASKDEQTGLTVLSDGPRIDSDEFLYVVEAFAYEDMVEVLKSIALEEETLGAKLAENTLTKWGEL